MSNEESTEREREREGGERGGRAREKRGGEKEARVLCGLVLVNSFLVRN